MLLQPPTPTPQPTNLMFNGLFGLRVQLVKGFRWFKGPIGSRVKLVHWFNWLKQIGTVKENMKALEDKVDEKKPKTKSVKIVEFGLTNTTTQQPKRTHTDVGSPTSPETKKSPKKPKGGDKNIKK